MYINILLDYYSHDYKMQYVWALMNRGFVWYQMLSHFTFLVITTTVRPNS